MGRAVAFAIVSGIVGIIIALIGKHYFGVNSSWVSINPTINVGIPKVDPAQEDARRANEARRKHEEELAAIRRRDEQARLEAEANRRRLEAARAAEEADAAERRRRAMVTREVEEAETARRQRREAMEAERIARANRIQEWRNANGGCDPPLRKQCMTVGSSGGGPRQVVGCFCQ